MSCAIVVLLLLHLSFLCFGLLVWPDLDPMVFVIIYAPWLISKGLDHPYLHVYACLLLCFILVLDDDAQKINRLDDSGLNDLEGLKKENKESKETGVNRSQPLR